MSAQMWLKSHPTDRDLKGSELAEELWIAAVGLGHDKTTEFSRDIGVLHLLSAKVAATYFGFYSENLEKYENSVNYYKNFLYLPHCASLVEDWNLFKTNLLQNTRLV